MTSDDEFLDVIYKRFCEHPELMKMLGNPTTAKQRTEKIHRTVTPLDYATSDKLNFLSVYYTSTVETDNDYVVRGYLNIDYFAKSRDEAALMKKYVREVMETLDLRYQSTHGISSDAKGVFRFRDVFRPLLFN